MFRGKTIFFEQIIRRAGFTEGVFRSDHRHRYRFMETKYLSDSAAKPTFYRMFFTSQDRTRLFCRFQDGFLIDRFDGLMLITRAEIPFSFKSSAAFTALATMIPQAMMVTSLPETAS